MSHSQHFSLSDKKAAAAAFDFIELAHDLKTIKELKTAFSAEVAAFGFEHFLFSRVSPMGHIRHQNAAEYALEHALLKEWPDEWHKRYVSQGYVNRDPVARQIFSNTLPFTWNELRQQGLIRPTEECIFDEARTWQMNDGLAIPIRSLDGLQAAVTLAGRTPNVSNPVRAAIHLIVIYTDAKEQELSNRRSHLKPTYCMSPRERECIKWIIAGKSTWDISQILGLSEQTVAAYIRNAMQKMNVTTRAQLVAEALRSGEIEL